ncbi:hypothetical protein F511_12038 [Dorcoceras hygrometricum]|uniref:Uncharacterized protein n=1 Tax=Dorcoceras hygrometricum TaxID=472368 RepID=A0A2Z7C0F8_9LAMI|nr:hypothetical protein F511_12038 [Dorcoceras hygrometricum]
MRSQCARGWQPARHHARNRRAMSSHQQHDASRDSGQRVAHPGVKITAANAQSLARRSCMSRPEPAGHCAARAQSRAHTCARVFIGVTFLATRAWLRPVSRGNRHFTVGGGRLRQSGPRPEGRLLRQPALEGLTRSAWTDSPRQVGRNKFRRSKAAAAQGGGGGF